LTAEPSGANGRIGAVRLAALRADVSPVRSTFDGGALGTVSRLYEAVEVLQRAVRLNGELAENRVLANDDRDAAEEAAPIINGKWSDPED
jgi:hypothetical protein